MSKTRIELDFKQDWKNFQPQDDEQNWHYRETGITKKLTLQKNWHYRKTDNEISFSLREKPTLEKTL